MTANALTAVNDATGRATLARLTTQAFDQGRDADFFSIATAIEAAH